MNIAVVGYGYWGPNLVRNLLTLPSVTHLTIVEHDAEAQRRAHQDWPSVVLRHEVPWTELDGVCLAVPAGAQYGLVSEATEHRVPVFCEKPCGGSLVQAQTLCTLSRMTDTPVMVGYTYLYHPYFEWLRTCFPTIGHVQFITATRTSLGPKVRADVSVVEDVMSHDIALALALFGVPDTVEGESGSWLFPDHPDTATGSLRWTQDSLYHRGNLWMTMTASWYAQEKVRLWRVVGSTAMLTWDDMRPEGRILVSDCGYTKVDDDPPAFVPYSRLVQQVDVPWEEPLRRELTVWVNSIQTGERTPTDIQFTVQVWQVMERLRGI